MRSSFHGSIQGPAVAVVGAWDPLVSAHEDLFRRLGRYARRAALTSLVILLEPHPARFIHGWAEWATYDDVPTRLALIQACGVDAVLVLRFSRQDVAAGAKEFLSEVHTQVKLSELWLGAYQVLGSGPGGSTQTIAALCAKRKITLKRLPTSRESRMSGEARSLLSNGRLREAIQLVGRPPVWSRPRSGKLRLAWRVGDYLAVPLPEPTAQPSGAPLHVHLEAVDHQPAILRWPDPDIRWLAFVGTSTARPSDRST